MGNPQKGEITFEAGGKDYTLVFSNNAFCVLEDYLGRGVLDIYDEIGSWSPPLDAKGKPKPETEKEATARAKRIKLSFCRALFWAGLKDRHPEMTIEAAGNLMDEVGGLVGVMKIIANGVAAASPAAKEGGSARPPKKPGGRGTGPAS